MLKWMQKQFATPAHVSFCVYKEIITYYKLLIETIAYTDCFLQ